MEDKKARLLHTSWCAVETNEGTEERTKDMHVLYISRLEMAESGATAPPNERERETKEEDREICMERGREGALHREQSSPWNEEDLLGRSSVKEKLNWRMENPPEPSLSLLREL